MNHEMGVMLMTQQVHLVVYKTDILCPQQKHHLHYYPAPNKVYHMANHNIHSTNNLHK